LKTSDGVFRLIRGAPRFPATNYWNKEAKMLAKYTLSDTPLTEEEVSDLTVEERLQVIGIKVFISLFSYPHTDELGSHFGFLYSLWRF
jgi:hypothetical protein